MASVVEGVRFRIFGYVEQSFFVEEQRPKMVFEVEYRSAVFVLFEFPPDTFQKIPILQRFDMGAFLEGGGTIAPESEYIHLVRHRQVDDGGYLVQVRARYGCHDGAADSGLADKGDFFYCRIEGAGFADCIVRISESVYGELVFVATLRLEPCAYFIGQMKRIAQNRKGNIPFPKQCENIPKAVVQNRVAARDVEVGETVHAAAHLHTIRYHLPGLGKGHVHQFGMPFGKDVAMGATLVAAVGDMPLESEIFHDRWFFPKRKPDGNKKSSPSGNPSADYLSPAPQAEPQAPGLGAGLGSPPPAPQAEPQGAEPCLFSALAQR